MTHRIFLAHASTDKEQVRKLYCDLRARGLDPWLDEKDIRIGGIWSQEIEKAIRSAGFFLACLSSRSVSKTGYLQIELRKALAAFAERPPGTIYLIPARLDDCEIPDLEIPHLGLRLKDLQWVDLWREGGLDRLVDAIRGTSDPLPHSRRIFRDIDELWCPKMLVVPPGRFLMGSAECEKGRYPDEGPQHEVVFASAFALGLYLVTFEEYDHFGQQTHRELPDDEGWGRQRRPVIKVSWNDAQAYVEWLSKETGDHYRLPSEAEWEYACRAGTTTPFSTGESISTDQANYKGDVSGQTGSYRRQTLPVGTFPVNPRGLFDMHGNVWEWVQDVWHENYTHAPSDGSPCLTGDDRNRRVLRGASWFDVQSNLRAAKRYWRLRWEATNKIGFRVARSP